MKLSIDTLPLWDAFKQTEICPFCHLENKLQELFIDTYLGDSVMEPDVRIEVNTVGFCPDHFKLLFQQKVSKLGLALMTHTHLMETIKVIDKEMDALDKCCQESNTLLKRATGSRDIGTALDDAAAQAGKRTDTCVVCNRMALHMERYFETALYMWEHDTDFRRLFEQSGGFCIPHWGGQLKACKGAIISKKQLEFIQKLNEMEKKSLAELAKDLEWFTQKFDYRNTDKPWGNSKDALPRAINRIEGYIVKSDS
jgi:hypothetical protein